MAKRIFGGDNVFFDAGVQFSISVDNAKKIHADVKLLSIRNCLGMLI